MRDFAIILPAAGQSARFGGPTKKPLVLLDGRPVWRHTLDVFLTRSDVALVILVVDPADAAAFEVPAGVRVVAGGTERFASVANALGEVPSGTPFAAIHDAVRPLVTPGQIDAVFTAARHNGAAVLGTPVVDTLKRAGEHNVITATVPRAGLWHAQTPQAARTDWLRDAHARRGAASVTDDAALLEAAGYPVQLVLGDRLNIKITTPNDLALAAAIRHARAALAAADRSTTAPTPDAVR